VFPVTSSVASTGPCISSKFFRLLGRLGKSSGCTVSIRCSRLFIGVNLGSAYNPNRLLQMSTALCACGVRAGVVDDSYSYGPLVFFVVAPLMISPSYYVVGAGMFDYYFVLFDYFVLLTTTESPLSNLLFCIF
jgi:hypothetical protein